MTLVNVWTRDFGQHIARAVATVQPHQIALPSVRDLEGAIIRASELVDGIILTITGLTPEFKEKLINGLTGVLTIEEQPAFAYPTGTSRMKGSADAWRIANSANENPTSTCALNASKTSARCCKASRSGSGSADRHSANPSPQSEAAPSPAAAGGSNTNHPAASTPSKTKRGDELGKAAPHADPTNAPHPSPYASAQTPTPPPKPNGMAARPKSSTTSTRSCSTGSQSSTPTPKHSQRQEKPMSNELRDRVLQWRKSNDGGQLTVWWPAGSTEENPGQPIMAVGWDHGGTGELGVFYHASDAEKMGFICDVFNWAIEQLAPSTQSFYGQRTYEADNAQ